MDFSNIYFMYFLYTKIKFVVHFFSTLCIRKPSMGRKRCHSGCSFNNLQELLEISEVKKRKPKRIGTKKWRSSLGLSKRFDENNSFLEKPKIAKNLMIEANQRYEFIDQEIEDMNANEELLITNTEDFQIENMTNCNDTNCNTDIMINEMMMENDDFYENNEEFDNFNELDQYDELDVGDYNIDNDLDCMDYDHDIGNGDCGMSDGQMENELDHGDGNENLQGNDEFF